jgi:diacylglycerol kinase family enzyme
MAEATKKPERPALIINPHSGGGKAQQFGLVDAAAALGLESFVLEPDDDLGALAAAAADRGADHLMMAGGDGSLGVVAEVAVESGTTFGCVPVGTRNHFAMDIGLDRDDPLAALQAVAEPTSLAIDYARIGGRMFLNNASFGVYATAIGDPDYRDHRTRSLAEAARRYEPDSADRPDIIVEDPSGTRYNDTLVLLISNNPYAFRGPPDFGSRTSLTSGQLGVLHVAPKHVPGPGAVYRPDKRSWTTSLQIVDAESGTLEAGVDGELLTFSAPLTVECVPLGLHLLVPPLEEARAKPDDVESSEAGIAHLTGTPVQ